jgi:hypothetical protein
MCYSYLDEIFSGKLAFKHKPRQSYCLPSLCLELVYRASQWLLTSSPLNNGDTFLSVTTLPTMAEATEHGS